MGIRRCVASLVGNRQFRLATFCRSDPRYHLFTLTLEVLAWISSHDLFAAALCSPGNLVHHLGISMHVMLPYILSLDRLTSASSLDFGLLPLTGCMFEIP